MNFRHFIATLTLLACWTTTGVRGQDSSFLQKQVPFFAAALSQVLSDSRSFSAAAVLQLPGNGGEPGLILPLGIVMLDGKMRWELDVNRMGADSLEPTTLELVKQFKLDRVACIIEPEKNLQLLFPKVPACVEVPRPKSREAQLKAQDKVERLEKKLIGREMVGGYECLKYQLSISGAKQEMAYVWQAEKLKDFPLKLSVRIEDKLYDLQFSKVNLSKPDARYFAVPANYTRYADMGAFMQSVMAKSLGEPGLDLKMFGNLGGVLDAAP